MLTKERNAGGRADTCRFLAAGATRSLWLRARQGQLAEAGPSLTRDLAKDDWVIFESNSILKFLKPSLYPGVLDHLQTDFKPPALGFIDRADALVPIESHMDGRMGPAFDPRVFEGKPRFPVAAPDYFSSKLCQFVGQRLLTPRANLLWKAECRPTQKRSNCVSTE